MEASSGSRSRNLWSAEEDNILRGLVKAYEKDKIDWRVIASFLPGRNNKDCRKRWHYRVSASMNLGPWSQSEDELLKVGIQRYSTHWSRVAQVVGTRNGDQCFKRWNDVLDPGIDRSPWTREEDRLLLLAIGKYGRSWKQIVDTYFPGRTGLDAKNRHRQLTRKRKREEKGADNERSLETSPSVAAALPRNEQPQTPHYAPTSTTKVSSVASPVRMGVENTNDLLSPRSSQQSDERPLSAPPYFDWNVSLDTLLSPPLPNTPYSTCSNSSISNAGGSLSELDEYFPHHLTTTHVDHGNGLLAETSAVSANYPFYMATLDRHTTDVEHPHYLADHGILDMRLGTTPIRPISSHQPFWGAGWNVTT